MYQEVILDHYRHPQHAGLRDNFNAEVHHVNTSCGDELTLRVHLSKDGTTVEDISYDAEGCSISQASTSVMAEEIIGRPVEEAMAKLAEFEKMITSRGKEQGDEDLIGDGVAFAVRHLLTGSFAPIGAALFGFLYAPLVITGVHQTTLAIDMQMIQSMGGTPVWPLIALSNIAQASAVVGIIIASRKQNEREISVPAAISAYLGVTEPAMYGINLKYRFPMLCAMIGSGLAGLLCGLNGVLANGIGVGGLPGILSIQPTYWQVYAMAMAIAVVVPIILTSVVYQRKYRQGTLQIV